MDDSNLITLEMLDDYEAGGLDLSSESACFTIRKLLPFVELMSDEESPAGLQACKILKEMGVKGY